MGAAGNDSLAVQTNK